jgi:hypothetical protein
MHRLPLAVVAALAPDVPAATTGLVAQLLAGVDRMRLSGLDAGSVARMVAERLGVPAAAELAALCLAATGGKPLLLLDLLQALAAAHPAPGAGAASHVPRCGSRQLGESVLMRLSQSGTDVVGLAMSVALLGQTELETAAAAAGLTLATAVTAAATLGRMDVLTLGEQVAVRHEFVRHAILTALPEGERGQLPCARSGSVSAPPACSMPARWRPARSTPSSGGTTWTRTRRLPASATPPPHSCTPGSTDG